MIPEFTRPLQLDRVGALGLDMSIEATPVECGALALRMDLPAVHALSCSFHLEPDGSRAVLAEGRLRALVTQTCVVTLEDFEVSIEEDFRIRFVPAQEVSDDIDLEADDEIPYEGNQLDLGEAAAEQLGLVLDPYPRRPGVELKEQAPEATDNPFSVLRRPN